MISDGEDFTRCDPLEPAQLAECGALMVVQVAEAQVNRVSLMAEFGKSLMQGAQSFDHAIHHAFITGDESDWSFGFLNERDIARSRDQRSDASEYGTGSMKKLGMPRAADSVPVAVIAPLPVSSSMVNLAFMSQQEVGLDRRTQERHTLQGMGQGAPRVDCPDSTGCFEVRQRPGQCRRAAPVIRMADERSVEIRADKPKGHHSSLLRGPLAARSKQAFILRPIRGMFSAMKSAYEIAMSRLEAQSPTAKLTDAQKAELAEIDSVYAARIAERRVFLEGEIRKTVGDPVSQDQLRRQLSSEVSRLEEEREAKKEKARRG